jgi:hypothetical protein
MVVLSYINVFYFMGIISWPTTKQPNNISQLSELHVRGQWYKI